MNNNNKSVNDIITAGILNKAMKRASKKALRENNALGLDNTFSRRGKIILHKSDGTSEVIKTIPKPVRYNGQPTVSIGSDAGNG